MPSFRIDEIANSFSSYPELRSNQYEVYIKYPSSIGGFEGPLFASSVTLPGRSLATTERRTFGPQRDMPYERLFSGDLDITFILQKGGTFRARFEDWMDKIIDPNTNRIANSRNDYLGEIEIDFTNSQGDIEYGLKVLEVFPKAISPIALSYRSENEVVEQQISFSFRNYEQKNTGDSGGV